jgi:CSLREA domain-containing protein
MAISGRYVDRRTSRSQEQSSSPILEQLEPRLLLSAIINGSSDANAPFTAYNQKAVTGINISGAPAGSVIEAVRFGWNVDADYVSDVHHELDGPGFSGPLKRMAANDDDWYDGYEETCEYELTYTAASYPTLEDASVNGTWWFNIWDKVNNMSNRGRIDSWWIQISYTDPGITLANWKAEGPNSITSVYEGTTVTLDVDAYGYNGQTVFAQIYEQDSVGGDDPIGGLRSIYISGGQGSTTWTTTRQNDGVSPDNRYYYIVDGYRSNNLDVLEAPDTTRPANPTSIDSTSHNTRVWSQDSTIDVRWSGASDNKGLAGYYYTWSASSSTTVTDSHSYASNSDGSDGKTSLSMHDEKGWYFHIRYVDTSGNLASNTLHCGPFYVDDTDPNVPALTSPIDDSVVLGGHQSFDWEGGDETSGINQYELLVESDIVGHNKLHKYVSASEYTMLVSDTALPYERLRWSVRAQDNAGNWSDWCDYEYFTVERAPVQLEVPYYNQSPGVGWCWASSLSMLLEYYGHEAKPWTVAAHDYFNAGVDDGGREAREVEEFLEAYYSDGHSDAWTYHPAVPLATEEGFKQVIVESLDQGHPVFLSLDLLGPGSHDVIATGYSGIGDDGLVYINDPSGALVDLVEKSGVAFGVNYGMTWRQFFDNVWKTFSNIIHADPAKLAPPTNTRTASIEVVPGKLRFSPYGSDGLPTALGMFWDGQDPYLGYRYEPGFATSISWPAYEEMDAFNLDFKAVQSSRLIVEPSYSQHAQPNQSVWLRVEYDIEPVDGGSNPAAHRTGAFLALSTFEQVSDAYAYEYPISALEDGVYKLYVRLKDFGGSVLDECSFYFDVAAADYHAASPLHAGFAASTVHSGDSFSVFVDLENTEKIPGIDFTTRFYASTDTIINPDPDPGEGDFEIGYADLAGISANGADQANWNGAFPSYIPMGTYYVGWAIEGNDKNQGNNSGYIPGRMLTVLEADIDVELPGQSDDVHSYPFGHVEVGDSVSRVFTVRNEGNETIVVSSLSGVGSDFEAEMFNTILPGETQELTITFSPQSEGSKADTLVIHSNDPDEAAYEIALAGTGVAVVEGDLFEDDDSPSRATMITIDGVSQEHTIHVDSDVDWVKFTLSERSRATIETDGASGDTRMWLYGPNEWANELDDDNDGGDGSFSRIVRDGADALEPGTYYVKIDEDGNNNTINGYTVAVTASPTKVIYLVTSLEDTVVADGDVTLREAIQAANTNAAAGDAQAGSAFDIDVITFDPFLSGGTITLDGTELTISGDLEIYGLGADQLTVNADSRSRVFFVETGASVLIDGLMVSGGDSDTSGGGIINEGVLTLTNATVSGNSAEWDGGGIDNGGALTVTNTMVSGNSAGGYGGGIGNYGALTLTNSMVFGNSAGWYGGGIDSGPEGDLTVTNVTISGNSAARAGGGLNVEGPVTVTNSTISGNLSWEGGGLCNRYGDPLILNNTIIALNRNPDGYLDDFYGIYTGSGNLLGIDPSFILNPSDGGDGWGDNPDTLEVDEGANDDYGDLRLGPGSVAIDFMGVASSLPPGATDLGGDPRVVGGVIDVGAYEYQGVVAPGRETPALVVDSLTDVLDLYDGAVTLREAILYAGLDSTGSEITFASSLLASGPASITLNGMWLLIGEDMRIVGPGPDLLTVDGDGRSRVFSIFRHDIDVDIEGLKITGGVSHDCEGMGGGILNRGDLTLTNMVVSGNLADTDGGGIDNKGVLAITDTIVTGNLASGAGGGIYNDYGGVVALSDTTVRSNTAAENGGGILNEGSITLTNAAVSDNSANWDGGGIYSGLDSVVTLSNTIVSGNLSEYGGGIYNHGALTLANSTVSGNSAESGWLWGHEREWWNGWVWGNGGGGIFNCGDLALTSSTIANNSATDDGGGIYNYDGVATLTNTTVSDNLSSQGGGIYKGPGDALVLLRNSVVAGNLATLDNDIGGEYSAEYSFIGTENGDPMLRAVTDGDGIVLYYLPHPDSPLIDAGDDALAVDHDGVPLMIDQLGNRRIDGRSVDIGSVELHGVWGYVYDDNGLPLDNAEVLMGGSYTEDDGENWWHSAFTDETGRYDLYLPPTDTAIYPLQVAQAAVPGDTYHVYAKNVADPNNPVDPGDREVWEVLYGDLESEGFVYLGESSTTAAFDGGYNFYVIQTRRYFQAAVDGIATDGGASLVWNWSGAVDWDKSSWTWRNNADDGEYLYMGKPEYNQPNSFVASAYQTSPDSMTVHVVDLGLPDQPIHYGAQLAEGLYAAPLAGGRGPDFNLDLGATLRGQIITEDEDSIYKSNRHVPLELEVQTARGVVDAFRATIDEDGYWEIQNIPADQDAMLATEDGFWEDIDINGVKYAWSERWVGTYKLAPGEVLDIGILEVQRAACVSGTVTDSAGLPIAGAIVDVMGFDALGGTIDIEDDAITDQFGRYRIDWIPSGEVELRISKDGWQAYVSPAWITLATGQEIVLDATLAPRPGSIIVSGEINNYDDVAPKNAAGDTLPWSFLESYHEFNLSANIMVLALPGDFAWEPEDYLRMVSMDGWAQVEDGYGDYFIPNGNPTGAFEMNLFAGPESLIALRVGRDYYGAFCELFSDPVEINGTDGQIIDSVSMDIPIGTAVISGNFIVPDDYLPGLNSRDTAAAILCEAGGDNAGVWRAVTDVNILGGYLMEDIPDGTYYIAGVAYGLETYVSEEFTVVDGQQIAHDIVFNRAPDDISLSNTTVEENSSDETVIGTLSGVDPDGDELTFTLPDDADGRFGIINNELVVVGGGGLDYESDTSHDITVKVSDGELTYSEVFTISVTNVVDIGEYRTLVSTLGQVGDDLASDFDGDGRVGLSDFVILRRRFGNAVAAPSFTLESPIAAAPVAVAPVVSAAVSELELGGASGAGEASVSSVSSEVLRSLTDYWFTEVTSPVVNSDQSTVVSSQLTAYGDGVAPRHVKAAPSRRTPNYGATPARSAVRPQLAATSAYDLRPLSDNLAIDAPGEGDLLVDLLAESALASSL